MHGAIDNDGVGFLYHLALRCAALPGSDRVVDVQLLVHRCTQLEDLVGAVLATDEHCEAHPDDEVLAAAHGLLVDAFSVADSARRANRNIAFATAS